jgi:Rha family phage regulatory protein
MQPNPDLFPETLLVQREGERIYTTSLKVAEFSGRRHTHVLRAIENKLEMLPEDFRQPNFGLAEYLDAQKKPRHMYEMTEEGFALTMMGFTGPQAVRWQVKFIEEFMAQRVALMRLTASEAAALYHLRPRWQPIARHPDYSRQQLIGLTGHRAPGSITACRRRMREVGLLPGAAA